MGLSMKLTEAERLLLKLGWERAGDSKDILWLYRAPDGVRNPHRTLPTQDTRYLSDGSGRRRNDPATAYINADGSYVIRNDVTGDIVQVSDRNKPNWKAPWAK